MSDKPLYSSHIFMFPFRFDCNEASDFKNEYEFYKKVPIEQRVNIELSSLKKKLKEWKYKSFDLEKQPKFYNEYAYFYDYARDAIYNKDKDKDAISYYFEKENLDEKSTYEIKILKRDEPYILNITSISLRVFATGVAILSIELENRSYKDLKDILNINDFGRRIYPQYMDSKLLNPSIPTKKSFLADYITIKTSDINVTENFEVEIGKDIVIGKHIMTLLGEPFTQDKSDKKKDKSDEKKFYIQPILDDRMFVVCWHGNDEFSKKLVDENYITNDEWYQFVFVDNDLVTVQNKEMKKVLLQNATYVRWSGFRTFFGITRYSFVLLSESLFSLKENNAEFIVQHISTMYFQMVTLLLATRASILRFSDEIAAVASSKDSDRLEELYERYLTFYNRLYFKEVTHQDQGIELYDIARKQMRIDEHMEKLDNKFTKLFEFADLKAEKNRNEGLDLIAKIGAIFLPPSLMVALLSMGIFDYEKSYKSLAIGLVATLISGLLGYFAIKGYSNEKRK